MKKLYVIAPLAALLIFGGFYWNYETQAALREATRQQQAGQTRQEKLRAEQLARTKAHADATAANEKRQQERIEKEQFENAQKQARTEAEQRRVAAFDYEKAQRARVERLRGEVDTLQASIARTEAQKRTLQDEQTFLNDYVKNAELNRRMFFQLIEKLEAAEKLRPTPAPDATSAPTKKI